MLAACAEHRVAVVPFGGGTSVVGGVEPVRDGMDAAVSLDLGRLTSTVEVDRTSLTARLDAGLFGPEAERRLGAEGVTLGHFPQSFEYSTVGGWVATRSAGQASTGYGRIDELVEAVRCVTPAGEIGTRAVPASAAGPSTARAARGLRGRARRDLRGHGARAARACLPPLRGLVVRELRRGLRRLRVMEQAEASADVNRLSDEAETGLSNAMASSGSRAEGLGKRYLRLRGHEHGCIAILGFEGEEEDVERRRRHTAGLLRGRRRHFDRPPAGRGVAARPLSGPYLRDELLDRARDGRDARDRHQLGQSGEPPRRGRGALRKTLGERGTPRS